MGKRDLIGGGIELVDVGGSFARLVLESPKIAREVMKDAVAKTAFSLANRMRVKAPVGPDSPHIRDAITVKQRGAVAQVGYIDATQAAGPDNEATIAEVALYNEYRPNQQPFMRPSGEAEAPDFTRRCQEAIGQLERRLGSGVGI